MDVKQKIKQITDTFGMSQKVQAKAMNLSYGTIKSNWSEKAQRNKFNEKNLSDLKLYIIDQAKKIKC